MTTSTTGEYIYVVGQICGNWFVTYWGGPNEDGEMHISGCHTTERRARNWAIRNLPGYTETTAEGLYRAVTAQD